MFQPIQVHCHWTLRSTWHLVGPKSIPLQRDSEKNRYPLPVFWTFLPSGPSGLVLPGLFGPSPFLYSEKTDIHFQFFVPLGPTAAGTTSTRYICTNIPKVPARRATKELFRLSPRGGEVDALHVREVS